MELVCIIISYSGIDSLPVLKLAFSLAFGKVPEVPSNGSTFWLKT